MPYIDLERRAQIAGGDQPVTVGELAYQLSLNVERFMEERQRTLGSLMGFVDIAEPVTALTATLREYQRQVVEPYEDSKLKANGPVHRRRG